MTTSKTSGSSASATGPTTLQKVVLGLLAVLLVGSIAVRAALAPDAGAATSESTVLAPGASALTAGGATAEASESPEGLEKYLPYLTEASFFGLIGFALGYTTRKIVKILLILMAVLFLGTQAGVQAGWFEVDWDGVIAQLNEWVFNLKENATFTDFLTDRVPSAAALLAGWVVGFKKG